jgi:hypothetical protein
MYQCKYRLHKKEGKTCNFVSNCENKICPKHQSKLNDTSYILANFEDFQFKVPEKLFYNLMKHLIRYYRDRQIPRTFNDIVDYIYSKKKIRLIILENQYIFDGTKSDEIETILFHTTAKIIQRWFRNCLYMKIIKYKNIISQNEEDAFTFDKIEEIPSNLRFYFKDINNHCFCFNAIELEFFVSNINKWNPYTKNNISDKVLRYLDFFLYYNKLLKRNNIQWESNIHAFVEVSQVLEKAGFYNDVKWFQKFSYDTCDNIVKVYQTLFREPGSKSFGLSFSMTPETYVFDFCEEVLLLFSTYVQDYLSCCNFVKVLAFKSDDFYNNVPNWLLQIESPIIDFNYDTGFLIMYIDNLYVSNEQLEYDVDYDEYNI